MSNWDRFFGGVAQGIEKSGYFEYLANKRKEERAERKRLKELRETGESIDAGNSMLAIIGDMSPEELKPWLETNEVSPDGFMSIVFPNKGQGASGGISQEPGPVVPGTPPPTPQPALPAVEPPSMPVPAAQPSIPPPIPDPTETQLTPDEQTANETTRKILADLQRDEWPTPPATPPPPRVPATGQIRAESVDGTRKGKESTINKLLKELRKGDASAIKRANEISAMLAEENRYLIARERAARERKKLFEEEMGQTYGPRGKRAREERYHDENREKRAKSIVKDNVAGLVAQWEKGPLGPPAQKIATDWVNKRIELIEENFASAGKEGGDLKRLTATAIEEQDLDMSKWSPQSKAAAFELFRTGWFGAALQHQRAFSEAAALLGEFAPARLEKLNRTPVDWGMTTDAITKLTNNLKEEMSELKKVKAVDFFASSEYKKMKPEEKKGARLRLASSPIGREVANIASNINLEVLYATEKVSRQQDGTWADIVNKAGAAPTAKYIIVPGQLKNTETGQQAIQAQIIFKPGTLWDTELLTSALTDRNMLQDQLDLSSGTGAATRGGRLAHQITNNAMDKLLKIPAIKKTFGNRETLEGALSDLLDKNIISFDQIRQIPLLEPNELNALINSIKKELTRGIRGGD